MRYIIIAVGFVTIFAIILLYSSRKSRNAKTFPTMTTHVIQHSDWGGQKAEGRILGDTIPSTNILDYFNLTDGVDIKWSHATNSIDKLTSALNGDVHMIEADVQVGTLTSDTEVTTAILAHPPDSISDISLEDAMGRISSYSGLKGIKLDFKSIDALSSALPILQRSNIQFPVWMNADIIEGPNSQNPPRDPFKFVGLINQNFPKVTLSLGWTGGPCCEAPFTKQMIEEMWSHVEGTSQPVTYAVRVGLLNTAWNHFKWLLDRDLQRSSITLWTVAGQDWEGADPYDLLSIRNSLPKTAIFYDLDHNSKWDLFSRIAVTAGNPINHFYNELISDWDARKVLWKLGVNSIEELQHIKDGHYMVQGNVALDNHNIPIIEGIQHLTLEDWLKFLQKTKNGIHIKTISSSIEAIRGILSVLSSLRNDYQQPIWLEVQVCMDKISCRSSLAVEVDVLESLIKEIYPEITICLQYKYDSRLLTNELVNRITHSVDNLQKNIKLPVVLVLRMSTLMKLDKFALSKFSGHLLLLKNDLHLKKTMDIPDSVLNVTSKDKTFIEIPAPS